MTIYKPLENKASHRVLRRLFSRAVTCAATVSAVATLSACSEEIDLDGFEQAPCDQGASDLHVAGETVDYVELMGREPWGGELLTSGKYGTACATASDAQTCQEALAAARVDDNTAAAKFLVTTRGDAVERWQTREEVMALLGTIDTPGAAVLMAWYDGYTIGCEKLEDGAVKAVGDHFEVVGTKLVSGCTPIETRRFRLRISPDGTIEVIESVQISYDANACIGRRPEGLLSQVDACDSTLARYWSVTAHLEASAVRAFHILADELLSYGAPNELIQAARRAAADEVEHTEMTAALAHRYGGVVVEPEVEPMPQRSLEAFALDNAIEGCVRETFGAAVGMFQSQHACDAHTREIMAQIAADETRHASVSWEIAAWLEQQLSEAELVRVQTAQRHAIAALRAELRLPVPMELVDEAGLPTPDQAATLFHVVEQELWCAA